MSINDNADTGTDQCNGDKQPAQENTDTALTPCGKTESCGGCSGAHKTDMYGNGIDRGQFFRYAFTTAAVAWGGMTLFPIAMYLNPPPGDSENKSKVTSLEVCKLADLPKGTGKNFRFGSFPAVLIHTEDGQLHAFNAICTHLGCTVQFRSESQDIFCACHGGKYDADTGKNIAGPPPKPLTALKAEVVDGKIIVSIA